MGAAGDEARGVVQIGADRFQGLDGLRGIALLMVIVAHLNLMGFGWIGMQSFFVLSGFLITRILLSDQAQAASLGDFFRKFYMRRVLRVFPVYYGYLIGLTLVVYLVPRLAEIRGELPAAYLYVYNFHMIFPHEHTRTLGHLWSMSVEEQFYLVWPWLIAFVPRRMFPYLCIALIGLGPALREAVHSLLLPQLGLDGARAPIYTYILTTSYVDAFAAGALVNFMHWTPPRWLLPALVAAMLAIGFAVNGTSGMRYLSFGWPLFMPHAHQYAWGYTLVNLLWLIAICSILAGGTLKQLLSLRVFDWLGKRSYSSYVIHFPLLSLMNPLWQLLMGEYGRVAGTLLFMVPYFAVVLPAGAAMYRWIEMPANALKEHFRPGRAAAPRAGAGAGAGADAKAPSGKLSA